MYRFCCRECEDFVYRFPKLHRHRSQDRRGADHRRPDGGNFSRMPVGTGAESHPTKHQKLPLVSEWSVKFSDTRKGSLGGPHSRRAISPHCVRMVGRFSRMAAGTGRRPHTAVDQNLPLAPGWRQFFSDARRDRCGVPLNGAPKIALCARMVGEILGYPPGVARRPSIAAEQFHRVTSGWPADFLGWPQAPVGGLTQPLTKICPSRPDGGNFSRMPERDRCGVPSNEAPKIASCARMVGKLLGCRKDRCGVAHNGAPNLPHASGWLADFLGWPQARVGGLTQPQTKICPSA